MFWLLFFFPLLAAFENDAIGVRVFKPTGPNTSNSLQCNEYAFVKYTVNNSELLQKASFIDLELVDLNGTVAVASISKKIPFKSNGFVAFFPWQLSLQSGRPIYSVAMKFFDEQEQLILVSTSNGQKFEAIHSAAFAIPQSSHNAFKSHSCILLVQTSPFPNHTLMNFAAPATRSLPRNRLFTNSDDVIVENEEPIHPLPYTLGGQEPLLYPNGAGDYCSLEGLPFYRVLDSCITDPFIPMKDLQNLNGIIRPKTKFIGKLLKLDRLMIWHQRTFTVDGGFLCCFHPQRVGTVVRRPPLDVHSTNMIDTVLPDGEDFWQYSPKVILPIASFRGIYILDSASIFNSWQVPTVHRLVSLAETCASGLVDPVEDLRWVNMLRYVSSDGKINLLNFRRIIQSSVMNVFMIVHENRFYLMRAHSQEELLNWITVLCAKWIVFNDTWKMYAMDSENLPPVFV